MGEGLKWGWMMKGRQGCREPPSTTCGRACECETPVWSQRYKLMRNIPANCVALLTGTDGCSLYVCYSSHVVVLEDCEVPKVLRETFHMEQITINRKALFFGQRYMKYVGTERELKQCLRYQICITLRTPVLRKK